MIRFAIIFMLIGLVAGLLGFGVIANAAMDIAKFFFFLFVGVAVLLFVAGWWVWKKVT